MTNWLMHELFSAAGSVIDGWAWLSGEASAAIVNQSVQVTRNRPHPFSTVANYTSWQSLTDRTYLARHLPPAIVPRTPPEQEVSALFQRPAGQQRLSKKSTCLFPAFAQYLTDSFIRTDPLDPRRTTTNHDIDLCPLYGRTIAQTNALRQFQGGRLKSQKLGNEEFPLFLYPGGNPIADAQFADLDPPLFQHGAPASFTPPPEFPKAHLRTIFAVGGDRVNSTPFSAMMNTLLLREHNRIAGQLHTLNPTWDDERLFQTARNIMIAMFIKIVVEQYINHITPLPFSLRADPKVAWTARWNRPNWITAEFSLLYRWHSLMPDTIRWPEADIPIGSFSMNNQPLLDIGLNAGFLAASTQPSGEIGALNTAQALLPIECLSVRQARRNQLDTYNNYRVAFGMTKAQSFTEISTNPAVVAQLQALYESIDNLEFYPGLFAEDLVPDSPLPGLLMRMVAVDAFSQALTNPLLSEHVWNAGTFTQYGFDLINNTSKLGDILARNSMTIETARQIEMTQPDWRYTNGP